MTSGLFGRVLSENASSIHHPCSGSISPEGDQASAVFGFSVATARDVNGDGYAGVVVGAYRHDNGQTDEGRAFVYHGSPSGLSEAPGWTAESNQADAYFGYSVSTAGDVNGDGYADVIVGAPGYDNGQTDEGRAFVYLGSASGLAATAGWTAESDQGSTSFGYSVGTAGDVNGDGYGDVIVGAYSFETARRAKGGRTSTSVRRGDNSDSRESGNKPTGS